MDVSSLTMLGSILFGNSGIIDFNHRYCHLKISPNSEGLATSSFTGYTVQRVCSPPHGFPNLLISVSSHYCLLLNFYDLFFILESCIRRYTLLSVYGITNLLVEYINNPKNVSWQQMSCIRIQIIRLQSSWQVPNFITTLPSLSLSLY